VFKLSLPALLSKIVESEPEILDELLQERLRAAQDDRQGIISSIRHGSVYRSNPLLNDDAKMDSVLGLILHADEVDTAANSLGSRSGRNLFVVSVAIGNARSTRVTKEENIYTIMVASKETLVTCGRNRLLSLIVDDVKQCREGIYYTFIEYRASSIRRILYTVNCI